MSDDKKLEYLQERMDTVVDRIANVDKSLETYKASLDVHLDQDEKLHQELSRINTTLHNNTLSLQDHMRRTDLLEEYVKSVDTRFSPLEMELLRKKAVSNWISIKLKLVAKLGAAVTAGGAIGMALKQFLQHWMH